MKILLLSGASSIHTVRWANGLAQLGHDVHLVTQQPPIEPLSELVTVYQFKDRGVLGYYLLVRAVRKIIRRIQPDIINAHYASGYGTTARLVNLHPYILSVWGADVYEFPDKSILHRNLIRKNILAADLIASTSYCMADRVKKVVSDSVKIEITPFGVDTSKFINVPDEQPKEKPFVVGTVKVLAKKYGIDILIRAFARFVQELKLAEGSVMLRIVGEGPEEKNLRELANSLSMNEYVEFLGRVPHSQVPNELNQMDVYAALSRDEGESFGVAVIEASACGVPVIVSNVGGLPEVVKNSVTGLVVEKEDVESAFAALVYLYSDSEVRQKMSARGIQHVRNVYSWESSLKKMLETYNIAIHNG